MHFDLIRRGPANLCEQQGQQALSNELCPRRPRGPGRLAMKLLAQRLDMTLTTRVDRDDLRPTRRGPLKGHEQGARHARRFDVHAPRCCRLHRRDRVLTPGRHEVHIACVQLEALSLLDRGTPAGEVGQHHVIVYGRRPQRGQPACLDRDGSSRIPGCVTTGRHPFSGNASAIAGATPCMTPAKNSGDVLIVHAEGSHGGGRRGSSDRPV